MDKQLADKTSAVAVIRKSSQMIISENMLHLYWGLHTRWAGAHVRLDVLRALSVFTFTKISAVLGWPWRAAGCVWG